MWMWNFASFLSENGFKHCSIQPHYALEHCSTRTCYTREHIAPETMYRNLCSDWGTSFNQGFNNRGSRQGSLCAGTNNSGRQTQLIWKWLLCVSPGFAGLVDNLRPGYSAKRTMLKLLLSKEFSPNRLAKATNLLHRILKVLEQCPGGRMTRRWANKRRPVVRAVWKVW